MENYSYNSSYPESGDSSPRSREIDFENPPPWEDSQNNNQNYKVKFMCSYGGKIHPRPHDNQLAYVGGETKILAVDRSIKFAVLLSKLIGLCDCDSISFKYQLPGEDLDALISVTNDDDLEHMMHEYDRLYRVSPKPARLRIFVFPSLSQNPSLNSSVRSFGSEEGKSEKERFVDALNSAPIMNAPPQSASPAVPPPLQPPASNVDFLFGLEKANAAAAAAVVAPPPPQPIVVGRVQEPEDPIFVPAGMDGSDPIQKHIQDLQRLRLEEQQQQQQQGANYRRKSDDYAGEYYRAPERNPQAPVHGGVPYGVFPSSNEQQPVYMIQAPANAYHATPMMRPVTGAPSQGGYYTVQRMPQEIYRDQQQQMYNMMPQQSMAAAPASLPPQQQQQQKVTGYSDGYGVVRPTESGYAQMAYDGGMGRQVIYSAPGGVMPAGQYAVNAEMRQAGALNQEAGGKVIAKGTQSSV